MLETRESVQLMIALKAMSGHNINGVWYVPVKNVMILLQAYMKDVDPATMCVFGKKKKVEN